MTWNEARKLGKSQQIRYSRFYSESYREPQMEFYGQEKKDYIEAGELQD